MDFKLDESILKSLGQKGYRVGNDIVFLPAFKETFNDLFRNKVYTPIEIAYCEQFDDPILRYASTWAAKEAVFKAIKQLDDHAKGYKAIEINRTKAAGKPFVTLTKSDQKFDISLSITHDGDYVWAVALVQESF